MQSRVCEQPYTLFSRGWANVMQLFSALLLSFLPFTQAILRLKFRHWFPSYDAYEVDKVTQCQPLLKNYYENNRTVACRNPCACAADCLLQGLPGTIQSNFASAQVLLGFLPATLVFVGPTIAEVAALSTYTPLLAILIALGSPAINLSRILQHIDVLAPFTRPMSRNSRQWPMWLARQDMFLRIPIRMLSYIGAIAAIVFNIKNAIYTDLRTISGWRCGALFMPLVWSLLAVVVHAWGMIAIRVRSRCGYSYRPSLPYAFRSNLFLKVSSGKDCFSSELLFFIASACAPAHLVFGVLDLSSLIFISTLEALQLFVWYLFSAVLCQLILTMELAIMRYEMSRRPDSRPGDSSGYTLVPKLAISWAYTA